MDDDNTSAKKPSRMARLVDKVMSCWEYASQGVWRDSRHSWKVNAIKTANLSARSFLNSDIQTQACAMTYRTLLAIVPALALLFAIGRGFGLQDDLKNELFSIFPAQQKAISYAMGFIESYLQSYSEGLFVGVGVVFLLYTLISLFSNIEDCFNLIWGVKTGRSFGRKIIDYTAMLLILPVIMLSASGISIVVSSTLQTILHWHFMTPVIKIILELLSWLLTWCFFGALYLLMPNAKVKLGNAFVSGIFAGTGFRILQWLFITGQLYVSRYNAIYGSFSFLPLMLIWTQLTWVIVFAGAVLCYSSQNIFMYSFNEAIESMSSSYYARLVLALGSVIVQRFVNGNGSTTVEYMVKTYNLPPRLASMLCDKLVACGVLSVVEIDPKKSLKGYQPALDPAKITVAEVFNRLDSKGSSNFIPEFKRNFPGVVDTYGIIHSNEEKLTQGMLLRDIKINLPDHTNP